MKNNIYPIVLFIIIASVAILLIVLGSNSSLKGITPDVREAESVTYTSIEASVTPAECLSATSRRFGLTMQNQIGNDVRFYFQSTSTGITATSGIELAAGEEYTPEFIWTRGVWCRSETGTSTVVFEEAIGH